MLLTDVDCFLNGFHVNFLKLMSEADWDIWNFVQDLLLPRSLEALLDPDTDPDL